MGKPREYDPDDYCPIHPAQPYDCEVCDQDVDDAPDLEAGYRRDWDDHFQSDGDDCEDPNCHICS